MRENHVSGDLIESGKSISGLLSSDGVYHVSGERTREGRSLHDDMTPRSLSLSLTRFSRKKRGGGRGTK